MYMHVLRTMAGWTLTDVHACIKDPWPGGPLLMYMHVLRIMAGWMVHAGWTLTDVHACIKDHGRVDPY